MNDLPPADEVKAEAKATTALERKDAVGLVTPARIPGQVLPPAGDTFLGRRITPLTRRRLDNFRTNRRGFWSLWIFLVLFVASLFAEFIANDRPLLIQYDGAFYFPVFRNYPETAFGGFLPSEADYRDPAVKQMIDEKGWIVWPLIPFGYRTITDAPGPYPAAPSRTDWLGTDDQGRDVLARLIYGFRISVLFGLALTFFSSIVGVAAGAVQGYFGGLVDLGFQRFIEIWEGLPVLYLLIILATLVEPNFWWLLGLMLLFSWTSLVGVVRAEFLRARNFDYVRAARALRVSFSLDRGETVALVGESGSGKSVTALSILQLLPYPAASHTVESSIRFAGEELVGAAPGRLREVRGNRIAMVFQEPMTSLNPLHTLDKQVAETLLIHKHMSASAARARTLELLRLVGLRDAESRLGAYPHQLSGGQRQRVMIAMAIANEPDILIADEPTTALDVTIQAQILELMRDLKDRLGMALLLITHDLSIVRHMAERVCVMTHGEIVEQGPTEAIFARPQHPYTRRLLAAEPKGRVPPADPAAPVLIEGDKIKVWFPIRQGLFRRIKGYVKAVDGVSLKVRAGSTLGVVGESGSGKTTLGLALLRLLDAEGAIRFRGRDIAQERQRRLRPLRREMQVVFQDPYSSLSPRLSIAQIVGEGLRVHNIGAR